MNEKLTVKNFGPIRDAELELKKTTVLIGPQGSGKSTLAKLVAIFNDYSLLMSELHWSDVKNNQFKTYSIHNFFEKETELTWTSVRSNSKIVNNKIESTLSASVEEALLIFDSENYMRDTFESFKSFVHKRNQSNDSNGNRFALSSKFFSTYLSELFPISKYIPTERQFISSISESALGLINSGIALNKTITTFGSDFERARKYFSKNENVSIDYLGINYKYENGVDVISHNNSKESNSIKIPDIRLSESASGYQSVVPIHVVVDFFTFQENVLLDVEALSTPGTYTIFLIEEPELNLYPTAQKGLISYLVDRCNQVADELLITTHSPYVLSSLNILLLAYKVWQKHPGKEAEIAAIVPKESWLNPEEFAAYYVADGTVRSIIGEGTGLISENELDDVSEDLAGEQDALMNIFHQPVNETTN